jgi:hypothetical protein
LVSVSIPTLKIVVSVSVSIPTLTPTPPLILFPLFLRGEEKNGCVRDRVGKIFGYLILLGYSHAFFQGVMFLYFSGNKNFIYTAFERIPGAEGLGVKLLFALFEIMYHIQAWTATLMNTFVLFASLENIALWNEHVRSDPSSPSSSRGESSESGPSTRFPFSFPARRTRGWRRRSGTTAPSSSSSIASTNASGRSCSQEDRSASSSRQR